MAFDSRPSTGSHAPQTQLTRRGFLGFAVAGVAALARPTSLVAAPPPAAATTLSFRSVGFAPPSLSIAGRASGAANGHVFLAPLNGPGEHGPMIVDERGELVWFHPLATGVATTFRVQHYRGRPVLTWWQGLVVGVGTGDGEFVIFDEHYRQVAQVRAANGLHADLHEFLLTDRGTAIFCAYNPTTTDLTALGGKRAGPVLDSVVQEVDVATGRALFEWHSLDHIPVSESYLGPSGALPFDYFHVNSVDVMPDGNLLVSARNTSALYKVDRKSGGVLWRLGGKRTDFQLGPRANFMWQHDARIHGNATITLFDDGPSSSTDPESRAIKLTVDESARRATLAAEYKHAKAYQAVAMGSAEVLADGGVFVGWGTVPGFTEYGSDGSVRFDGTFVGGAWNYRAFRFPWRGRPLSRPSVGADSTNGSTTVYASWNGSTETRYWRVRAGERRGGLAPVHMVAARGFETAVRLRGRPRYVAVTALDAAKRALGESVELGVPNA